MIGVAAQFGTGQPHADSPETETGDNLGEPPSGRLLSSHRLARTGRGQQGDNLLAGAGRCQFEGFVDMHIVLGHALRVVAEQGSNRQFREAEFPGDAGESMAQRVGCDALNAEACLCATQCLAWFAAPPATPLPPRP
jgi:hypothetical protein